MPKQVKSDRSPHLDSLIAELTETFAIQYEKKPSEEEFERFEELVKNGKFGKNRRGFRKIEAPFQGISSQPSRFYMERANEVPGETRLAGGNFQASPRCRFLADLRQSRKAAH